MENVDFKLVSLNVRGIRSPSKRKALFIWLNRLKYDIIFLQETCSTEEIENIWRTQWKDKLFSLIELVNESAPDWIELGKSLFNQVHSLL